MALAAGAAGAGAIWLPGCGAAGGPAPVVGGREADELVARLERGLRSVRESPFAEASSAATAQPWRVRPDPGERVIRLGLEALVVADVARSIPPGAHVPEHLAQRLGEALPILDECVTTYHALLERTPPAVRRNLDRAFRGTPDVAMQITEVIDQRAGAIGVSNESRLRLRNAARNVGTRVRRQSASALIDDCVSKVDGIAARVAGGDDLRLARGPATTAMIDAIWQEVEGTGGTSSGGVYGAPPPQGAAAQTGSPVSQGVYVPPEGAGAQQAPPSESGAGDPELAVGGVMLGVGAAAFGIGGIVTAVTGNVWVIVGVSTPAGVAVIIGLILLIVGAVQNARG